LNKVMDRTLGSASLSLGRFGLPVVGLAVGMVLATLAPAQGGLVGPGALVMAVVLAIFTGLAKTSTA